MKRLALLLVVLSLSGCGNLTEKPVPPPKPPDEVGTIRLLGEINQAQTEFHRRTRRYALAFDELVDAHLMHQEPSADDTGYEIKLRPTADAESYTITANPIASAPTARHFFSDDHGEIRAEQGKDANAASPKI